MRYKFEFNNLPKELQTEIAQNLLNRNLINLGQISKSCLFNSIIEVRKLLHYVVRGEHEAVEKLIKRDISLILKRGTVTDCSGRTFDHISSFEYTLWSLDKPMWALMLACVSEHKTSKHIFARLLSQYNHVHANGVTYYFNGKTISEKHFDFENTIIKELQTQVHLVKAGPNPGWDIIEKQWREGIGGAQRLLPVHVVHEYCSNEPFSPQPQFNSKTKASRQLYHWTTRKFEDWFDRNSALGSQVAIYKALQVPGRTESVCAMAHKGWGGVWVKAQETHVAIKTLYEVRKEDFVKLKPQLVTGMTPENQQQIRLVLS